MAAKIALCALRHTFAALHKCQHTIKRSRGTGQHTQAISTFFGRDEFGSLTLTKANWMRPSENSSIRSSSSPSASWSASLSAGLHGRSVLADGRGGRPPRDSYCLPHTPPGRRRPSPPACVLCVSVQASSYVPPVLWTFKTLSLPPSCWNALTSGAATVKTAHWPYVGELACGPDGGGELTMLW